MIDALFVSCVMRYRYIPNITKALFSVIQKMESKSNVATSSSSGAGSSSSSTAAADTSCASALPSVKQSDVLKVLLEVSRKTLTEATLSEHLQRAVDKYESDTVMQNALEKASGDAAGAGAAAKRRKLFITPDRSLWECPLPHAVSGAGAAGDDAMDVGYDIPVRQGSLQSTVVDLTGGAEDQQSPGRKRSFLSTYSQQSATTMSRTSSSSSKLSRGSEGVAGSTGQRRWVKLSLAASGTVAVNADGAPIVAAAVPAYILVTM